MPVNAAELQILTYPAPALRAPGQPIIEITDEVHAVVARMTELLQEANGVGLAAPQVGLAWQLFITRIPDDHPAIRVHINPTITPTGNDRAMAEEGCLSLPGINVEIARPKSVKMSALDLEGRGINVSSDGFSARVWQHEFDHLNGVLIIDKMNPMDRLATRKALKELEASASGVNL